MSLFTYIALPREVDMSKITLHYAEAEVKAHVDLECFGSSAFTFWAKDMAGKLTERFPFGLVYIDGQWQEAQGIYLHDPGKGKFEGCFSDENPVRYEFFGELGLSVPGQRAIARHQRRQLFDLLKMYLKPGEKAELYAQFTDHSSPFHVGPPQAEFTIAIDEVLTDDILDMEDGDKVTIVMP